MGKIKRVQTWFGTPIPPFKEQKFSSNTITIRFVLTGKVPSKKNNQQTTVVKKHAIDWIKSLERDGKPVNASAAIAAINMVTSKMIPNRKYIAFVESVKPTIQQQMQFWVETYKHKGLTFPLTHAKVSTRFYFKSRYITDTVNKEQTILDLLQECGVVMNDDYGTLNPKTAAAACYFDELIYDITYICLTFDAT